MSAAEPGTVAIHASEGARLKTYRLDPRTGALGAMAQIELPQKVQYGWYAPGAGRLYVAVSDGGPRRPGSAHAALSFAVDAQDGRLSPLGAAPLPARSVAICLDAEAGRLFSVSNDPVVLAVCPIGADGVAGPGVPQPLDGALGVFPHQVRMLPGGRSLVVVARGNPPSGEKPGDPGSLRVFGCQDGRLAPEQVVAPGGGAAFGARNLDFHPRLPMAFVGLESQSRLLAFRLEGDRFAEPPVADLTTLERPEAAGPRQLGGSVKVHPSGRYVYTVNRADGVDAGGELEAGENSIAAFALDEDGIPHPLGQVATGGVHARTFAIDPSGRWMIVANMKPRRVRGMGIVPPSLASFRIGADGTLRAAALLPLDYDEIDLTNSYTPLSGTRAVFWMGLAALGGGGTDLQGGENADGR